MTELLDWSAPNGTELLCTWLAQLAECRTERSAGAVLPFITVRRSGGGDDGLVDTGRYSISVFHHSEAEAQAVGDDVHRRLRLLAGRFTGQARVGDTYTDNMRTIEGFRPEPYGAEPEICRLRAIYEVALRIQ